MLYPADEVTQVRIVGRAAGAMNLYAILAQHMGSAMSRSYRSIPVKRHAGVAGFGRQGIQIADRRQW